MGTSLMEHHFIGNVMSNTISPKHLPFSKITLESREESDSTTAAASPVKEL
jgi:hypothetical protein